MVVVTVAFAQDAVYFAGEKLRCQLRFTNPLPPKPEEFTSAHPKPFVSGGSVTTANVNHTVIEDGRSVASSRSSFDSYTTTSTAGARSPITASFPPETGAAKPSDLLTSHPRGNGGNPQTTTHPMDAPCGNFDPPSPSHPTATVKAETGPKRNPARHGRAGSLASWFSKLSVGVPEPAKHPASSASGPPNPEVLLWGYVQLVGHFTLDESFVRAAPFEPLKAKRMYCSANGLGGGGTLGTSNPYVQPAGYGNGSSNSSGLAELKRLESRRFPVLSTPPTILFCDLALGPGQSKVFDYELVLPDGLPSSHRGKAVKILYYLIVGTQRGRVTHEPSVVQLPFRLFSGVDASGRIPEYDLMEPVLVHTDHAVVRNPEEPSHPKPSPEPPLTTSAEFLNLALETLSLPHDSADAGLPHTDAPAKLKAGCLKVVYGITRKVQPVSYTFNKDDTIIGRLYLRRPTFRVGEAIHVLLHFLPSPIKCYQVSVTLESFEQVVPELACQTAARIDQLTRQILAQSHLLPTNADRIAFHLPVPNHCTPGFVTSAVSLQYRLRLEFLVAERTPQNVATTTFDRHYTLNRAQLPLGTTLEKLVCVAPVALLPTHPAYAKIYKPCHTFRLD
ncbi:Golgi membrane exchange factor (Ric1p-Rgp1p) subunit [Massospora cicadina]|nr:Golgi membrane exchange factor (Ric1p-Rgp1p) subunit [Massospora cicadina]